MKARKRKVNHGSDQSKKVKFMLKNLHEMLRSFGQQSIGGCVIQMDEFQQLRKKFGEAAEAYEHANKQLAGTSDPIDRSRLVFTISQNKIMMEDSLKNMTTITIKLKKKINTEKKITQKESHKRKKKNGGFDELNQLVEENLDQSLTKEQTLEEKDLDYKNLIIYNLQHSFFKLIKTQRKEVKPMRKDLNNKQWQSLQDLLANSPARNRLIEGEEQEETLQQKEMLQSLEYLDKQIELKMNHILEGVRTLHSNALTISQGIGVVHRKIVTNLDKINQNVDDLYEARQQMEKAIDEDTGKPSCILNVVMIVILAFIAYLVIREVWFKEPQSSDEIKL